METEVAMRNSGIGGQAVMEGVMMRNKNRYAVACRKSDGEIVVDVRETKSVADRFKFLGWPFIRGTVNLIESMVIGIKTLTYSADFIDADEQSKENAAKNQENGSANDTEPKKAAVEAGEAKTDPENDGRAESEKAEDEPEKAEAESGKSKAQSENGGKTETIMTPFMILCTVCLSLLLTIALFIALPVLITEGVQKLTGWDSAFAVSAVEGIVRIVIFILYVVLIALMPDIKRVFCYHGAEHKTINCIEHGLPLTVENARNSSKEHKRCGTSFLLIVMVISILVFSIVNCFPIYTGDVRIIKILVRLGVRILLLPLVAGISYEFLKLAGRSNSRIMDILSRPGLWMQGLTTKEPDDEMLRCAIASVEAVFDWKAFLAESEMNGDNSGSNDSCCSGSCE